MYQPPRLAVAAAIRRTPRTRTRYREPRMPFGEWLCHRYRWRTSAWVVRQELGHRAKSIPSTSGKRTRCRSGKGHRRRSQRRSRLSVPGSREYLGGGEFSAILGKGMELTAYYDPWEAAEEIVIRLGGAKQLGQLCTRTLCGGDGSDTHPGGIGPIRGCFSFRRTWLHRASWSQGQDLAQPEIGDAPRHANLMASPQGRAASDDLLPT